MRSARELRADRKDCQLPSTPQGPRLQPQPSAELRFGNKRPSSPGFPQLYLAKVGVFPVLWTPTSSSWQKTLTKGGEQMCEIFYSRSGRISQFSEPRIRAPWDPEAANQLQHAEQSQRSESAWWCLCQRAATAGLHPAEDRRASSQRGPAVRHFPNSAGIQWLCE